MAAALAAAAASGLLNGGAAARELANALSSYVEQAEPPPANFLQLVPANWSWHKPRSRQMATGEDAADSIVARHTRESKLAPGHWASIM